MGRIALGWQLAKQSWAVVRADRTLMLFPAVGAIFGIGAAVIWFLIGAGLVAAFDSPYGAAPAIIAGIYVMTVIGQFAGVALAACADRTLHGQPTTFGDGIAAARDRMPQILAWAAVMVVVGGLINALQAVLRDAAGGIVGAIFGGIANAAWGVATFFVVPVLAEEGLGPIDAIKRSAGIIKARWGEGVIGSASIGLAVLLVGYLPATLVIVAGVALSNSVPALGILLAIIGVIGIVAATLVQAAVGSVFRVVLYRFATTGEALPGFQQDQLAHAFRAK